MDRSEARERLLRGLLYLVAAGVLLFWAPAHLFFPAAYHRLLGIHSFNPEDAFHLQAVHVVGALAVPIGFAALQAARDPRRNMGILRMLMVAGVTLASVVTFHIITGGLPAREWYNVATFLLLTVALRALSRSNHHQV